MLERSGATVPGLADGSLPCEEDGIVCIGTPEWVEKAVVSALVKEADRELRLVGFFNIPCLELVLGECWEEVALASKLGDGFILITGMSNK